MYLRTVRGEIRTPSLSSSSLAIRSSPHSTFSRAILRISSRSSSGIGRPKQEQQPPEGVFDEKTCDLQEVDHGLIVPRRLASARVIANPTRWNDCGAQWFVSPLSGDTASGREGAAQIIGAVRSLALSCRVASDSTAPLRGSETVDAMTPPPAAESLRKRRASMRLLSFVQIVTRP